MSFNATVYNLMLGGPSDVDDEIRVALEVIDDWNSTHTQHRQLVILPIRWLTHAPSRLGGRAQALINEDVLSRADFLFAFFATRIGTPTGTEISGTVEEIREHLKRGGQTSVYFASGNVPLDNIQTDQLDSLRAFKDDCMNKGIVRSFKSTDELRTLLTRDIALLMNQIKSASSNTESFEAPAINSEESNILRNAAMAGGRILHLGSSQGEEITAGKLEISQRKDRRVFAAYWEAVGSLLARGLIIQKSKNLYELTGSGYRISDQLQEEHE